MEVMQGRIYSILPRALELEPYHRKQFSFIPKTLLLDGGRVLILYIGYSQRILNLTEKTAIIVGAWKKI